MLSSHFSLVFLNLLFPNLSSYDILKKAIDLDLDINTISSNGEAALHKAIGNNQLTIVKILLQAKANPNLKNEREGELSPLLIASSKQEIDPEIFCLLIDAGANINDRSTDGENALMLAILNLNRNTRLKIETIQLFLKHGIDVNAKNNRGETALSIAKEVKNNKIIQILLEYGAK